MPESDLKPWDRFLEFLIESTRIFKGFSMALDAKKLAFAFAGALVWALGAMFISMMSGHATVLLIAGGVIATLILLAVFWKTESEVASRNFVIGIVAGIVAVWAIDIALIYAFKGWTAIFGVFQAMWGMVVLSVFGLAVARIAAMNATTDDTVSAREAARFAFRKFNTSIWTLLVPIVAILAFGFALVLVSFLGRFDWIGPVWYTIIGILYIIPLLIGLFFAAILLVYIPSLMLFQPAIAVEGSDSFDAVSTAYSCVFGRPWRLAFYAVLAGLYAMIVLKVAALLVIGAGEITNFFVAQGIGEKMKGSIEALDLGAFLGNPWLLVLWLPTINGIEHFTGGHVQESFKSAGALGGYFIVFWQHVLLLVYLAFAVSLFYSLITQVFLLMRKVVHGTPFDEVYIETSEEEEFSAEFAAAPTPAPVTKAGPATPKADAPKAEQSKPDFPMPKEVGPIEPPIEIIGRNEPPDEEKK